MGIERKPMIGEMIQRPGALNTWIDWGVVTSIDGLLCWNKMPEQTASNSFYWSLGGKLNDFYRIKPIDIDPKVLEAKDIGMARRKIREIAMSLQPSNPLIPTMSTWDQLYEIESGITGLQLEVRGFRGEA